MERKEYESIHRWMRKHYGKASKCEFCDTTTAKRYDWALKEGCQYSRDREVFIELCRSCHIKYDFTEKRSQKISLSQSGDKNNFFGKKFTEEMKQKQRDKKPCKPINCLHENGENLKFDSIRLAAEKLNLKKPNIISFLKGKYNGKTYKGWVFTYC